MSRLALALMALLLVGGSWPARAPVASPLRPPVRFSSATLAHQFAGGYGIAAADLDRDGKGDLIALGSRVAWFRNGDWSEHPLARGQANIALAAADLDGDGTREVAVASEFSLSASDRGGLIQWFERPPGAESEWLPHRIDEQPAMHRLRFADVDGNRRPELIGIPIIGRGSKSPYTDLAARVVCYRVPRPPGSGPWPVSTVDESLHLIHDALVYDWNEDGRDDLLLPSMEGVHLLRSSGTANRLTWTKVRLAAGEQARQAPNLGCSEVQVGRLRGRRRGYLATIEPWHGDQVVVYTPPPGSGEGILWRRSVIDLPARDGHTLAVGDFNADGLDDVVVGFRSGRQLLLYLCLDPSGLRWQRQTVDAEVAAAGVAVADLDRDGHLDIAAIGNPLVRWYRNLGVAAVDRS